MFRVLLCMTCCSAPPSRSGQVRAKTNNINNNNLTQANDKIEKQNLDKEFKAGDNEKENVQLLSNQIQAHNNNYGSQLKDNNKTTKIASLTGSNESVNKLMQDHDSITASTSAMLQKSRSAATNEEQDYTKYTELNFDDKSVSPPSSIDVEQFKESPNQKQQQPLSPDHQKMLSVGGDFVVGSGERNNNYDDLGSYETSANNDNANYTSIATATTTTNIKLVASASDTTKTAVTTTSKIGDYARLEYSPIEDLDSLNTSKSHSRAGSEGAGRFLMRRRSSNLASSSGCKSPSREEGDLSDSLSRRSSQGGGGGIESTSISIASQLSNEQLQQNLTNMLESANSPSALFGTIGLPLGPPLDREMTETRKTSPETTGAALTSASQDSLSDNSIGGRRDKLPSRTVESSGGGGGALVNDSIEQQQQDFNVNSIASNKEEDPEISTLVNAKVPSGLAEASKSGPQEQERVESALSMTTTTSGGLTNPTPTPSELSGGAGDGTKKKGKLRPKNLLKRFKSGKKKNKDDNSADK